MSMEQVYPVSEVQFTDAERLPLEEVAEMMSDLSARQEDRKAEIAGLEQQITPSKEALRPFVKRKLVTI